MILITRARAADLSTMIDCKEITGLWDLKTAYMPKNAGKVFSCFSCAGGSTMGYKLAGFDVIGMNEIDPKVAKVYISNHKPKYAFVCSIRDLVTKEELPGDMYNLDILDGSPPCTSFSTAGVRERDWGKEKKFSEGQAHQRLDDLFFEFIALANRLKPKIVIAENVTGIIKGNAKGYIKEIIEEYKKAGYDTQIFKLNAANMGVPQARERIFLISRRKDLSLPKIALSFSEKPIPFYKVEGWIDGIPDHYSGITENENSLWRRCKQGDLLSSVHPKGYYFTYRKIKKCTPVCTIHSGNTHFHYKEARPLSDNETIACSSFPMDYDWLDRGSSKKRWFMGMSVPPFMMQRIALEVRRQWGSVLNG